MPLAMGPQAVVCAPSRAACSVWPTAVAQLMRPWNSMQTRHWTLARVVVMKKKRRHGEHGGERVERGALHGGRVETPAKVGVATTLSTRRRVLHRPQAYRPAAAALRDDPSNCSCSVEPSIAVTDDCPPVAIWVISSK